MEKLEKAALFFGLLGLAFFLIFGLTYWSKHGKEKPCTALDVTIARYIATSNAELSPLYVQNTARAIIEAAKAEEIDPALLVAIIQTESRFAPGLRSDKGAVGPAQIMPGWINHTPFATTYEELREMPINIRIGAHVLRNYITLCGGLEQGLRCYNAGPARRAFGAAYATKVLALRDELAPTLGVCTD